MASRGRALVTGGAGFIGAYLCESLLGDGWEVFCLDDLSTGRIENVDSLRDRPGFHMVVDSVLSESTVNELVHRCDVVYHLAAAVGVRLIVEQPVKTLVTNVQGTENVLQYCSRFGRRVLVASTSEIYGDHRDEIPLHEEARRIYGATTVRRWAYADSKAMDELLALAYHQERGLECVIPRLFNTVGARQTGEYGMVVPRFVDAALAGDELEVFGDGSQTRCFCHVDDTVHALRLLMDSRSISGAVFNVGSTERISILGLAQRILALTESKSSIKFVAYGDVYGHGIEDMLHRIPATGKIFDAVGWRASRNLDSVLADVVAHSRGMGAPS